LIGARARAWWPATLWAAAVIAVSSIPRLRAPFTLFPHADKVAHGLEYALLGLLLVFGLSREPRTKAWRPLLWVLAAFAVVAAFGALDEWHQSAVPGRDMSGWDWLADAAGGLLGGALGAWIRGKRARLGKSSASASATMTTSTTPTPTKEG
jgi:VanZ family protein